MTAALVETKERPILFSAPMVRAILDGRKTQTRRVVTPQPASPAVMGRWSNGELRKLFDKAHCIWPADAVDESTGNRPDHYAVCPYGITGDRLWVRETFGPVKQIGIIATISEATYVCFPDGSQKFRSGEYAPWNKPVTGSYPEGWRWRPSIHMPRWASRIDLEITSVRVERLQEITEADAIAEGAQCAGVPASLTNRGAFAKLWESINGPESWAANPWVWVIEFKPVAK
jgi:hypothetical protein